MTSFIRVHYVVRWRKFLSGVKFNSSIKIVEVV